MLDTIQQAEARAESMRLSWGRPLVVTPRGHAVVALSRAGWLRTFAPNERMLAVYDLCVSTQGITGDDRSDLSANVGHVERRLRSHRQGDRRLTAATRPGVDRARASVQREGAMCTESTLVPIPDFLWSSGEVEGFDPEHPEFGLDGQGRRCLAIDTCIVPAIRALWAIGIVTVSCCCGHSDGTNGVLTIRTTAATKRLGTMLIRVEEYDRLRAVAD